MTDLLDTALPRRIVVLGSGELGKELAISFQRLGCTVIAVDSYAGAPAMHVADDFRVADMTDPKVLAPLLGELAPDLVVPEVEAIATDVLVDAETEGHMRVVPNAHAVHTTMDRQLIRTLASSLDGVRTSRFRFASSADDIRDALDYTGLPAFIKPTMSSSGHGQSTITSPDQADAAWKTAMEGARNANGRVIVEETIPFDSEITLLTVRSWDAHAQKVRTSVCAPIGHRQVNGDYVESWQPATISPIARASCENMARSITRALAENSTHPTLGLFGVEFFIRGDQAWFSELSPRPHDTGMVTMVTQFHSEFDLHARAILGLPVDTSLISPGASTVITSPGVIDNPSYDGLAHALTIAEDARIFRKPLTRAGRRIGVVLARGDTCMNARDKAQHAAALIHITHRKENTNEEG